GGGVVEGAGGRGGDVRAGGEQGQDGEEEATHVGGHGGSTAGRRSVLHFLACRVVGALLEATGFFSGAFGRLAVPLTFLFFGGVGSLSTSGSGRSGGSRPISYPTCRDVHSPSRQPTAGGGAAPKLFRQSVPRYSGSPTRRWFAAGPAQALALPAPSP